MKLFGTFIIAIFHLFAFGQASAKPKIHTSDIHNYWIAYDSVLKIQDTIIQQTIIQKLYLDKATDGLKDFISSREISSSRLLRNILDFPKFWPSLRENSFHIDLHVIEIETLMLRFQQLYPSFKQPDIFFTIGCLNSGGTTSTNKILIGTEIAASDSTVDASELGDWLQAVFKANRSVVYVIAHELVHTQQQNEDTIYSLLGACLAEGSCDFIAEQLLQDISNYPYMVYGKANEKKLWLKFENKMESYETGNWLYNGNNITNEPADLGYFIGYEICKSYFENSIDKKLAIKEIIELNFGDKIKVQDFLLKSKYKEKFTQ